jgi:hypothetical protein
MLGESDCHGALFGGEAVALAVTGLHYILKNVPHHVVREIARNVFSAMIPETDAAITVDDVDSDREIVDQVLEQFWVIQKVGRHG